MTRKRRKFADAIEAYREKLHLARKLTMDTERRLDILRKDFGHVFLDSIGAHTVHQWVNGKYRYRSASTVTRNLNVISAVLRLAKEFRWVSEMPIIRRPKPNDCRMVHLEMEEIMPVVEYVTKVHGAALGFLILLLTDTGVRFGEAMNMRWGDLSKEWITVRYRPNGNSKTKPRLIPASPRLIKFMEMYKIVPPAGAKHNDMLMPTLMNMAPTHIGKLAIRALREACITCGTKAGYDIRLHDLRHTFAYICACAGADIGDIRDLMGHENINITMRYRGFVRSRSAEIIRKYMSND